ncbi:hypothetical protein H0H81_003013 [Sphagnurus paluster]|uniref:Uncharacterized protein n=1 Tax=Sphagnurus paluster TaxID=117069 RepID=A0A9P7GLM4_9AGAR|nr:hypothetical protein H0H81_003013 [Sphagnurus paluster]
MRQRSTGMTNRPQGRTDTSPVFTTFLESDMSMSMSIMAPTNSALSSTAYASSDDKYPERVKSHSWFFHLYSMTLSLALRRRNLPRLVGLIGAALLLRWFFFTPSSNTGPISLATSHQIKGHNIIERATRPDKSLNVQRHSFLQARMGRDDREGILGDVIQNGIRDYWERFQLP